MYRALEESEEMMSNWPTFCRFGGQDDAREGEVNLLPLLP